jgi:DNA modification methylase
MNYLFRPRAENSPPGVNVFDQSNLTSHFDRLIEAARDKSRISGLTHDFYRYPARFSPKFVRAAIEAFSAPGDLVLDPFLGGGTTAVEALALGRNVIGTDVSSLAVFVAQAKTALYSDVEFGMLERWTQEFTSRINIHCSSVPSLDYESKGYHKHLDSRLTWRLRKAVEQALSNAIELPSLKLESFARCIILRTAQWALDGRKMLPSVAEFRQALVHNSQKMLIGARAFRIAVERHSPSPTAVCLHRSATGIECDAAFNRMSRPRLVLTSPPYPGIHVLYHRWQVDGRKETPAPFWIANKLDGSGAAYYTLGDRKATDNWTYFAALQSALSSVARICDADTTVVQVVAFSNPAKQLPRYLEITEASGFKEITLPPVIGAADGRLWRSIPNRKWHAELLGEIPASKEVVLFHRKT